MRKNRGTWAARIARLTHLLNLQSKAKYLRTDSPSIGAQMVSQLKIWLT